MKTLTHMTFTVLVLVLVLVLFDLSLPESDAKAAGARQDVKTNSMEKILTDKPYFSILIEADVCAGYFLLNGQLLYAAEMMPVKLELPVNHWMRTGENELVMMLGPVDEEGNFGKFAKNMKCAMSLRIKRSGTTTDQNLDITTIKFGANDPTGIGGNTPEGRLDSKKKFAPAQNGDVIIGKAKREPFQEVGAIVSRSVTLPEIGLPEWRFFKSDNITKLVGVDLEGQLDEETSDQLKQELLPIYRKIWSTLEARKVDEVLPLFEERSEEIDAALFRKPGETGAMLGRELKERIADPKCKLWPISDDNVMIQLYDNNKLVRLCQNNRKPLLSFDLVPDKIAFHYDVVFRKSGDKWIISR